MFLWLAACLLVGALAWFTMSPSPSEQAAGESQAAATIRAGGSPPLTPKTAGPTPTARPASLEEAVQNVLKKWKDPLGPKVEYGLVVHNLDTGGRVSVNDQNNYETASLYKLFVMLAVYYDISRGNLSLDTPITLTADAADAEEDGYLIVEVGGSMAVRDLLEAMITKSNNTAALMLLFQVKIPRLQQIAANLGFTGSDLSDSYNFQATAGDIDQLLTRLAGKKLLGDPYDQAMLDLLGRNTIRDRIPALLPAGTKVADKTGNLGNVSNDAGIIYLPNGQRLAITALVRNFSDQESSYRFISELSLAAYNFYSP